MSIKTSSMASGDRNCDNRLVCVAKLRSIADAGAGASVDGRMERVSHFLLKCHRSALLLRSAPPEHSGVTECSAGVLQYILAGNDDIRRRKMTSVGEAYKRESKGASEAIGTLTRQLLTPGEGKGNYTQNYKGKRG